MTISVKHKFQSSLPTDPAATEAGLLTPDRWNETHEISGVEPEQVIYRLDPTTTSMDSPYIFGSHGERKVALLNGNVTAYIVLPTKEMDYQKDGHDAATIAATFANDHIAEIDTSCNRTEDDISLVLTSNRFDRCIHHDFTQDPAYANMFAGATSGWKLARREHFVFEFYDDINDNDTLVSGWVPTGGNALFFLNPIDSTDGLGSSAALTTHGALKQFALTEAQIKTLWPTTTGIQILSNGQVLTPALDGTLYISDFPEGPVFQLFNASPVNGSTFSVISVYSLSIEYVEGVFTGYSGLGDVIYTFRFSTVDNQWHYSSQSYMSWLHNDIPWDRVDKTGAQPSDIGAEPALTGATADTEPEDADTVYGGNSGASFATIKTTWTTIKGFLKTYFDTLYATAAQLLGRQVYHGFEVVGVPYVSGGNLIIPTVGGEIIYWFAGTKYRTTSNITIPLGTLTADTQYYVYFTDALATAVVSSAVWAIDYTKVFIATAVFNGSAGYEIGNETHSYDRNIRWHRSAHKTYGTQYESGGDISSAASTFSISSFSILDEDVNSATAGATTSMRPYWRKNASTDVTFGDTLRNYLYRYAAGDGAPQYDDGDGTPADIGAGKHGCYWVYFTNDAAAPVAVVLGRGNYNTLALAQAETKPSLPNRSTAEWKLAYKVYYQNLGGTATFNSGATEDYRKVSTGPANTSGVSTLAASSVTYTPVAPDTSVNAQTAIERLNGLVQFKVAVPAAGFDLIGASTEPLLAGVDGTNRDWTELQYADGAASVVGYFEIPAYMTSKYQGGALTVQLNARLVTVTNAKKFVFSCGLASIADSGATDTAPPVSSTGFGSTTTTINTATDAAGDTRLITIAIATPGLTAGQKWVGHLSRLVTDGNDDFTGTVSISSVVIYE